MHAACAKPCFGICACFVQLLAVALALCDLMHVKLCCYLTLVAITDDSDCSTGLVAKGCSLLYILLVISLLKLLMCLFCDSRHGVSMACGMLDPLL